MSDTDDSSDGGELVSMDILRKWKVKTLKDWCAEHKQKISGNKEVLAKRVFRAMNYQGSDSEVQETDSEEELNKNIDIIPPTNWIILTTEAIPPIRDADVKNYFVFHKNPLSGKLMNFGRQLKKARKMAVERYISNIEVGNATGPQDLAFFRAKCKASMLSVSYGVSIIVTDTGMVQSGQCSCKAGQPGVCSHVGALLLTLVKTRDSCTSQPCSWKGPANNPLKIEPARFCDIRIYNPMKDVEIKSRPYPGVYSAGPQVDPQAFLKDLLDGMSSFNTECALYRSLRCDPGDISDFLSLFDVNFCFADRVNLSDGLIQQTFSDFMDSLHVPMEVLNNLEKSTRGQGVNANWMKARSYLITASNMGEVAKRKKEELDPLIRRIMYPQRVTGVKSIAHGNRNEGRARRAYAQWHMKKCSTPIVVEDRGLIVNGPMPYLGASIDGAVSCEQCGEGIVEIKCPYGTEKNKWRNVHPVDCAKSSTFCCGVEQGEPCLKPEHKYMFQVQGQMAVCELPWVDFVIWTKKGISVQRISRDDRLWCDRMLPKLRKFYMKGIVAELFTSRLQRGRALYKL